MYNKISSEYICPYDKNNLITNLPNIKQTLVSKKNTPGLGRCLSDQPRRNLSETEFLRDSTEYVRNNTIK